MHTADATILPPPVASSSTKPSADDRSSRHLDAVGVEAVLGAMVAAKRASRPAPGEVAADDAEDTSDADETTPRGRRPVHSEVFLKAR